MTDEQYEALTCGVTSLVESPDHESVPHINARRNA
jgi:hypothetical protein